MDIEVIYLRRKYSKEKLLEKISNSLDKGLPLIIGNGTQLDYVFKKLNNEFNK